ncbi:diguanylate cyclase domain-containing protein [Acetobacterium wieringae]
MIVMELDRFKTHNDKYGHEVGVLVIIAERLIK